MFAAFIETTKSLIPAKKRVDWNKTFTICRKNLPEEIVGTDVHELNLPAAIVNPIYRTFRSEEKHAVTIGEVFDRLARLSIRNIGELGKKKLTERLRDLFGIEVEMFPITVRPPKSSPFPEDWKKPTEMFSSGLFFQIQQGEHDIILHLIKRTQIILNKGGIKVDVARKLNQKYKGSIYKRLGYGGALSALREYVDWQDLNKYRQ